MLEMQNMDTNSLQASSTTSALLRPSARDARVEAQNHDYLTVHQLSKRPQREPREPL